MSIPILCLKKLDPKNTFTCTKQENFKIVTTQNLLISRCFINIEVLKFLSKYLTTH